MSPCRPAPAKPGRRRQPPPNPPENAAAAPDVVPRQPEFRQNANIISYLKNSGVQVGSKTRFCRTGQLLTASITAWFFTIPGLAAHCLFCEDGRACGWADLEKPRVLAQPRRAGRGASFRWRGPAGSDFGCNPGTLIPPAPRGGGAPCPTLP